jgi:DNA-binding NtrC family response regulator
MDNGVKLLIIDDDPKVSWILSEGLSEEFQVLSARDGSEGIQVASTEKPELILLDIQMPGMTGLDVLQKIKAARQSSDIIMLSGHGDIKNVVESMRLGASEFISKPFDVKEVEIHLRNIMRKRELEEKVEELESALGRGKSPLDNMVGDTPEMVKIKNLIEEIADSELTVLIRGESGTGKEIVARLIHELSSRKKEAFTKVNCAAIPRDLLEAELFGYEKGAFTGANRTKPGRFEVASKGTIFLDEIGEMPMELQSKLLQVLEQQEFVRVGGVQNIKVDVRIVCATNRNLEEAMAAREMRDDLYYRLNEITITLPPLRRRAEDVPLLCDIFIRKYNTQYHKEFSGLSPEVMERLLEFSWPGNVRQLENLVKQVVVRDDESIIDDIISRNATILQPVETVVAHNPGDAAGGDGERPYSLKKRVSETVAREEISLISEVLRKTNWNRRKAAEVLEISYRSLLYKIKEYSLSASEL